jgi:L-fucose mutarotase
LDENDIFFVLYFGSKPMLKNINPLLGPKLLEVLRAMGHGDSLCLVDANFPAESVAGQKPLIRMDGVSMSNVAEAVFSVLPLDTFVETPILRMEVVSQPEQWPDVHLEMQAVARRHYGAGVAIGSLERFAFYEAARQSFAVVATGDARAYGCFLIKKGVIFG